MNKNLLFQQQLVDTRGGKPHQKTRTKDKRQRKPFPEAEIRNQKKQQGQTSPRALPWQS